MPTRLLAALVLGLAAGALALRPPPLIRATLVQWLDSPNLAASLAVSLDASGLLFVALAAAIVAIGTRPRMVAPVASFLALIVLVFAGDSTIAFAGWLGLLLGSQSPRDDSDGAWPLAVAYFASFALLGATVLAASGGSTARLAGTAGPIGSTPLLLATAAVVGTLPLIARATTARGVVTPALLAIGSSALLIRTVAAWGVGLADVPRTVAAVLAIAAGVAISRTVRFDGLLTAWRRLVIVEVGLIAGALSLGGEIGIAAAVVLAINIGLSALPIAASTALRDGERVSPLGAGVSLGSLAGLPPLLGFVGRCLLVEGAITAGFWGIALAVLAASAAAVSDFATLGACSIASGDDPAEESTDTAWLPVLVGLLLVACGMVPAFLDGPVRMALAGPGQNTFAAADAYGWRAILVVFGGSALGLAWGADAVLRRDRRARRDRLRQAAVERERARRFDAGFEYPTPARRASVLDVLGNGLAGSPLIALGFSVAVLVFSLVVAAQ